MSRPIEDVTIQSARALTAALVLAYTTTVRSGCGSQKAANSSAGQPRSSEQVASRSGIRMRFFGAQDFRRLAHEAHAGDDQGLGRVVAAEARHLERIGDAAAGFLGQVLQVGVDVVVGDQHRFAFLEQAADLVLELGAFVGRRRLRRARPGLRRCRTGRACGWSYSTVLIGRMFMVMAALPLRAVINRYPGWSGSLRSCRGSRRCRLP